MSSKTHWESVYESKQDADLSWTQPDPALSLSLIAETSSGNRVIDVGGGTSLLPERLLDRGYAVTVLDISEAAIGRARARLGDRKEQVQWMVADVTSNPDIGRFDVWHDRAVFHFLTNPTERSAYVALLRKTVPPGGHAIIATFAPDGPKRCSGLDVCRYDCETLSMELGTGFRLLKGVREAHVTPTGQVQAFQYCVFQVV